MEKKNYKGNRYDNRTQKGGFRDNRRRDNEVAEEINEGLVIGRNAVRELLKSGRAIDKIFVQRGDREGSIVVLVAEATQRHIPLVEVDKAKLDKMTGFATHQGIVAMAAEKEYCSVDDILKIAEERGEKPFIVIADGITDPHNLGALIRCAEGVGAHGLVIPKRRAVGLTPVVTRSSCGAIEHLAIAKVTNLASTIEDLKEKGVWIFAAEAGGDAYYDTDFKCACAIVLGSEGEGVSHLIKEKSDYITSIPMYGHVNSFNVSTAAAVILAEVARQHRTL
jgi:23S rRNA (guanosine2251-2'-O)-methyltransferase